MNIEANQTAETDDNKELFFGRQESFGLGTLHFFYIILWFKYYFFILQTKFKYLAKTYFIAYSLKIKKHYIHYLLYIYRFIFN